MEPESVDMDPIARLQALEETVALQTTEALKRHEELLHLLSTLHTQAAPHNSITPSPLPSPPPGGEHHVRDLHNISRVKAALPSDFDGSRRLGRTFLNSCELYIQLSGDKFYDDQQKIHWALTFCKAGRAANFADRIMRAERQGVARYSTWKDFVKDFTIKFCESNEQVKALTKLEGSAWYQQSASVDDYIDSFEDLVEMASLSTDAGLIMKFRRGLSKEIQDRVAEMESPPALDDLEGCKDAARRFYQNQEANRAFSRYAHPVARPVPNLVKNKGIMPTQSFGVVKPSATPSLLSNQTPNPPMEPRNHMAARPQPEGPTPMEVDASRQQRTTPVVCYRCLQPGHQSRECPRRFDIRTMTADEKADLLEQLLAGADLGQLDTSSNDLMGEEDSPEFQRGDFHNSSK